jgi:ABC-type uncharacterized transport system ATPase subunit
MHDPSVLALEEPFTGPDLLAAEALPWLTADIAL